MVSFVSIGWEVEEKGVDASAASSSIVLGVPLIHVWRQVRHSSLESNFHKFPQCYDKIELVSRSHCFEPLTSFLVGFSIEKQTSLINSISFRFRSKQTHL